MSTASLSCTPRLLHGLARSTGLAAPRARLILSSTRRFAHSFGCATTADVVSRKQPSCRLVPGTVRAMATDTKFPRETKQDSQPGQEHEMDPQPSHVKSTYKAANKLLGKKALITGGDSGIGKAVAIQFAMEGASVAFTYLHSEEQKDAENLIKILREISVEGAKEPLAIPTDLRHEENCKKIIDQVVQNFGGIDILVNNAAEQHTHDNLEEVSTEEWMNTFATNIHAQFWLSKFALPHMKEGAAIVNSASVNAYKGNAKLIGYSTTKSAIIGFTRSLALSVVGRGIRVNAVAPGPVWTPLITSTFPEEKIESFGGQVPMNRAGQPEEIATAYTFLAGPDGTFYTGQCLHPNGGAVVNA